MATTISYTVSDFQPFTKIISADMNSRFQDIKNRLNWAGGTNATTGLGDDNLQSNTASGGGLTRSSKLKAGTANYVVINDAQGRMSEEAQLGVARGGLGFTPTLTGNAGKAIVVNTAETSLELGSPVQSALTLTPGSDISGFTAGESITANDAVCFDLAKDSSNNNIYRVFKCDSDLANRRYNFAGFAVNSGTVTAHTLTWVNSAALVTSNVISWSVNGRFYSVTFATDNDTTLAAIATKLLTDPDIQSASVVDAGSNDRQINITGKGGLQINITGAVVTLGASQATVTITTTQAPSGSNVNVRCFGLLSGFSGLTIGFNYYLSGTTGAITATPSDTAPIFVGQAFTSTQLFVNRNVGQFQFSTPTIFIRTHGLSAASTATADVEHFNYSSWSAGTSDGASAASGGIGDAVLGSNMYYIDGATAQAASSQRNNSYNKASWSVLANRTTSRCDFGITALGSTLYAAKGITSLAGNSTTGIMDAFNGTSWTNTAATLSTALNCPGCFTQGGKARWVAGNNATDTGNTVHDTYNGTSTGTDTVSPSASLSAASAASQSGGIIAGMGGGSTASYQWLGSSWSSSITVTYAITDVAAVSGTHQGASSGYNASNALTTVAGGRTSTPTFLTTAANFNGTTWAAATSMSGGRSGSTGGVL